MRDERQQQFQNFGKSDQDIEQERQAGNDQYGTSERQDKAASQQRDSQGRFEEGNTQERNSQNQSQRSGQQSGQAKKSGW